jgi:putative transcriptional regulator
MKPSAEDRIIEGLEEFANAMEAGEDVTKRFTCRNVVLDLRPAPYNPKRVRDARRLLGMSQSLFAQFLGVSISCVQGWEQGRRQPDKMACRFMDEIQLKPEYWRERLLEMARPKVHA